MFQNKIATLSFLTCTMCIYYISVPIPLSYIFFISGTMCLLEYHYVIILILIKCKTDSNVTKTLHFEHVYT